MLKAATESTAPLYTAILAVLVAAKERYQVQVRTEEIAAELVAAGHDPEHLTSNLEQLKDWGAVTWTQDTSRVSRLEDFHRRRELWQLTAAGHAAHDSVLRVLGAAEQAGSLQRALFRDIRENLDALAAAVDAGDATATYLRLRDLDGALRDLAANARDFHARMAELRREHELEPERFLAYKHLLLDELAKAGSSVRYHGDFDWRGLTIAAVVMRKIAGTQPWRYRAPDYERIVTPTGDGKPAAMPLTGNRQPSPWDPGLSETMSRAGIAIYEEQVLDDLLDDLAYRLTHAVR